jgi:tRNA(adenine34) deaminase
MESDLVEQDLAMMHLALIKAREASEMDEVPVGAVLADLQGQILASSGNNCIKACDPSGHAEMRVLRAAALKCGNYRMPGTVLYVTLEPCAMCASAMIQARVARVVFGALDPKAGAIVSRYRIGSDGKLNHSFVVQGGLLADESSKMLKEFFRKRRRM